MALGRRHGRPRPAPPAMAARSARSTSVTPSPVAPDSRCTGSPLASASAAAAASAASGVQRVELVQPEHPRLLGEPGAIGLELGLDHPVVLGQRRRGAVDEVQQHGAALDVARGRCRRAPCPRARPRSARGCRRARTRRRRSPTTPRPGMQRGERIVGDLRPGVRDRRRERSTCRRSAGRRGRRRRSASAAARASARRPPGPGLALRGAWLVDDLKRRLPQPPLPPRASSTRCAGPGQVGDQRLAVLLEDLGADRDPQHHVVGALAGPLLAHAGLAVLREEMLLVAVVDQRVQPLDRLGPDVAALAAVAAVRARRTRRTSRAGS